MAKLFPKGTHQLCSLTVTLRGAGGRKTYHPTDFSLSHEEPGGYTLPISTVLEDFRDPGFVELEPRRLRNTAGAGAARAGRRSENLRTNRQNPGHFGVAEFQFNNIPGLFRCKPTEDQRRTTRLPAEQTERKRFTGGDATE